MAKPSFKTSAQVRKHSAVLVTRRIIAAYKHIEKYESTVDYNKIEEKRRRQ